ncbi:MAG TPA: hypothetical protein VIY48_16915 [Candidatus Paceibacterota bacterium]
MMNDHAAHIDDEAGQAKQRMNCKLAAAKETLGSHWVLHPAYRFSSNPQHAASHKTANCLAHVADRARWAGRI